MQYNNTTRYNTNMKAKKKQTKCFQNAIGHLNLGYTLWSCKFIYFLILLKRYQKLNSDCSF